MREIALESGQLAKAKTEKRKGRREQGDKINTKKSKESPQIVWKWSITVNWLEPEAPLRKLAWALQVENYHYLCILQKALSI